MNNNSITPFGRFFRMIMLQRDTGRSKSKLELAGEVVEVTRCSFETASAFLNKNDMDKFKAIDAIIENNNDQIRRRDRRDCDQRSRVHQQRALTAAGDDPAIHVSQSKAQCERLRLTHA